MFSSLNPRYLLLFRFHDVNEGGIGNPERISAGCAIKFESAKNHVVKINAGVVFARCAGKGHLTDCQSMVGVGVGTPREVGGVTGETDDGHDVTMWGPSALPYLARI